MNCLKVVCCQDRQAIKMCMSQKCLQHSLICSTEDCSCAQKHQNCMGSTLISPVLYNINKKERSYEPVNNMAMEFYDSIIKYVITEKEEYQARNSNQSVLNKEEQKLMECIEKGNSKDIMPGLVFKTVKSLIEKPIFDIDDKLKSLEDQIKKISRTVRDALCRIRDICELSEKKKLEKQFSTDSRQVQCYNNLMEKDLYINSQLCHKNYSIDNNLHRVKLTKLGFNYALALISSPIECSTRIFIKIKSLPSDFFIGICDLDSAMASNFQRQPKTKVHFISSQGEIVNSSNKQQHKNMTGFRFEKKDVLQVIYNLEENELKFINSNKKSQVSLKFKKEENSKIFFCVCMFGVESEIVLISELQK